MQTIKDYMCSIFAVLQSIYNIKFRCSIIITILIPIIVPLHHKQFISLIQAQCRKVHQVESVPVHVPWTDCCQQWLHPYLCTLSLQKKENPSM